MLETSGLQLCHSHLTFAFVPQILEQKRDCLQSTVSIILFGNETRSLLPQLLVAGELYFNRSFYADREVFKQTTASDPKLKVKLFIY